MSRICSFPPVAGSGARRLILGSIPGRRSLAAREYYAHPRNAFWFILGRLLGFDPALPYPHRCERLVAAGIAVWDVLATCERASSLDSDIVEESIVANDLSGFLAAHPQIEVIYFNGAKAEASFGRHVLPGLDGPAAGLRRQRLPSTSPAHAGMSAERKLAAWQALLEPALARRDGADPGPDPATCRSRPSAWTCRPADRCPGA